jgi:flagellin-like hook-associated protein FlgL
MDEVSSTRTRLSEAQAALINELTSRNTSADRLPETNRSILDADTAKRIAESIQTNMQQRPMTSIRAQANAAPQGVIQLLA